MVTPAQVGAAMWSADHASRATGMELENVDIGSARLTMVVRQDMVNSHGICHGGYLFLLADSAMAFATNSRNQATVASGAGVDFIASARLGERLVAQAHEQWLGGRSAVTDVEVTGEGGRRIALFRGRTTRIGGDIVPQSTVEEPVAQPDESTHNNASLRAAPSRAFRVQDLLAEARLSIARLSPTEAQRAMQTGAVLIDTRMSTDRALDGVVPGSVHIPRTVLEWWCDPDWEWRDLRVADPDRLLIVMCNHGFSSSLAAANLRRIGLDAADLDGGFDAWKAEGFPVEPDDGSSTPTNLDSYQARPFFG